MPAPKSILFPTDFSEQSEAAIPFVKEWSQRFGASVHLLHILDTGLMLSEYSWADYAPRELEEQREKHVRAELEKVRGELALGDVECRLEMKHGVAYEEIARYAENESIDLIIMATHGRTGLSHLLVGSTTERVVRISRCPVLTVRADSLSTGKETRAAG
jgi:nucleotide-binding universal stress UspA family protein